MEHELDKPLSPDASLEQAAAWLERRAVKTGDRAFARAASTLRGSKPGRVAIDDAAAVRHVVQLIESRGLGAYAAARIVARMPQYRGENISEELRFIERVAKKAASEKARLHAS